MKLYWILVILNKNTILHTLSYVTLHYITLHCITLHYTTLLLPPTHHSHDRLLPRDALVKLQQEAHHLRQVGRLVHALPPHHQLFGFVLRCWGCPWRGSGGPRFSCICGVGWWVGSGVVNRIVGEFAVREEGIFSTGIGGEICQIEMLPGKNKRTNYQKVKVKSLGF